MSPRLPMQRDRHPWLYRRSLRLEAHAEGSPASGEGRKSCNVTASREQKSISNRRAGRKYLLLISQETVALFFCMDRFILFSAFQRPTSRRRCDGKLRKLGGGSGDARGCPRLQAWQEQQSSRSKSSFFYWRVTMSDIYQVPYGLASCVFFPLSPATQGLTATIPTVGCVSTQWDQS